VSPSQGIPAGYARGCTPPSRQMPRARALA
jgi:hypothetical protein